MASRAVWKGQLRLSLVAIPVELHAATKTGARVSFRQIHGPSGKPVRYEKTVAGLGTIKADDILKGYEVEGGDYLLLDPEEIDAISRGVALLAAQSEPKRFTAETSKAKRKGRIFIDWLRNERGATAVAPFSVRPRPGTPVACPVSWDELPRIRKASAFSTARASERGWADVIQPPPQSLTAPVVEALDRALSRT